ncbi:MAG TPA: iron transporter [Gammaproteobacteria bacterium]|nr:iron transporter [Gammaproteobacteria bacterium]
MKKRLFHTMAAVLGLLLATPLFAAEHRIGGEPILKNGLIVSAVYLQPVHMAPMLPGMDAGATDVHLEADIHADRDNPQGLSPGAWVPYLTITYHITKEGSDWGTFGRFMAMVANDGPHYGANVKLDGPGKYHLTYRILPPPYAGFFRHTDPETGVAEWWQPFSVSWDFVYVGVGKKGGY